MVIKNYVDGDRDLLLSIVFFSQDGSTTQMEERSVDMIKRGKKRYQKTLFVVNVLLFKYISLILHTYIKFNPE